MTSAGRSSGRSGHASGSRTSALQIQGYERFERIGSGGFSSVYSARQASLGRQVAIKVLSADVSSPSDRRAFERECQALGLVSHHPNIVTIYNEAFTNDGRPCIVMELYGRNYRERLDEEGPLSAAEALSLGVKMAGALHAAHLDGVLHRDLKPHNIFLSSYGEPALGDFGISTVDDERSISAASGLSVAYAAPEVLEDAAATVASDVYSLAATIYHLVEGAAPFASKQMRTTVRRILTEHPAPLTADGAPEELSQALQRALAKDPVDRYPSAQAFGEALRSVQAAVGVDRTPMPLPQAPGGQGSGGDGGRGSSSGVGGVSGSDGDQTIRRTRRDPDESSGGASSERSGRRDATGSAPRVAPSRAADASSEDEGEQTIRRSRRAAPEVPVRAESPGDDGEPSTRRRRAALALGAVAVGVVSLLALTVGDGGGGGGGGGGGDPAAASTTVVRPLDDDSDFLIPLVLPNDITVGTDDDGNALVSFTPVSGAVSYEIVSVGELSGRRFSGTSSPLAATLAVADAPCWKLVVLGEGASFVESQPRCFQA